MIRKIGGLFFQSFNPLFRIRTCTCLEAIYVPLAVLTAVSADVVVGSFLNIVKKAIFIQIFAT